MGQCCSSPTGDSRPSGEPAPNRGVQDKSLLPAFQYGGLQLVASSAGCAATPAGAAGDGGCTPLLVRHTPQGLFVALFEGLGEDRRSVAAYCRSRVFELFQESSVRHAGAPLEALKETLERLDADILATERLRHATKQASGASAVLLLVEGGSQRAYCANVGAVQCLLARITGSFNSKAPEGFFLTQEHTTSNREEMVRLQRRAPGEATPPPANGADGEASAAPELTRALGFSAAKQTAGGTGALLCEAWATDHALGGADQHLVLASSAFWRLVGPGDCALRAHFHEKFARRELDLAAAAAAAAEAAGGLQDLPSPTLVQAANTAEHLTHWCLEKAARRLGRLQQQRAGSSSAGSSSGNGSSVAGQHPSVADVVALPLGRPPAPAAPAAAAAAAAAGQLGCDEQQAAEAVAGAGVLPPPLVRSDVLGGELGVVVVTLRRQGHSMDNGMREVLMAAAARGAAAAAAAKGSAAGGKAGGQGQAGAAGGGGYVEKLAQRRWRQVRMLVDFHKAHRRVLLRQWWDAQDALFRRGRISGAGAGRINLFASLSPSKLQPVLHSAAAAAASGKRNGGPTLEGQGYAANKAATAAAAAATVSPGAKAARGSGGGIKAVRPARR